MYLADRCAKQLQNDDSIGNLKPNKGFSDLRILMCVASKTPETQYLTHFKVTDMQNDLKDTTQNLHMQTFRTALQHVMVEKSTELHFPLQMLHSNYSLC